MKTPHEYTWVPILWACKLIQRARTEGKVVIEPPVYANLISSLDYVEGCNRKILNYGWVNFPLAYTQVASMSVFIYFMAALFGRQYLVPQGDHLDATTFPNISITHSIQSSPFKDHTPDFYIPFFTIIEFLSYMGWIKVAETLLNPFGDDDEDFEINYIIDRNLQTCYLIVDEAEEELEMADDPFLEAGITVPQDLPEYKALRRKSSVKTRHLQVPSVEVRDAKDKGDIGKYMHCGLTGFDIRNGKKLCKSGTDRARCLVMPASLLLRLIPFPVFNPVRSQQCMSRVCQAHMTND